MFLPKNNIFIKFFFDKYITFIINRCFKNFNYNPIQIDPQKSILLIANHFSWWDGFIYYQLNKIFFKKKFYILVNEKNYKEHYFLKHLGAIGIPEQAKKAYQTLQYTQKILKNPTNLVVIFPQGKIYSQFTQDFIFQKGVYKIKTNESQSIYAATFIDFLEHKKASVFCNLAPAHPEKDLLIDFETHLKNALQKQQNISK